MKPIIVIASMALGSGSMAALVYLGSHPNALLSDLPPTHNNVEVPFETPKTSKTERATVPLAFRPAPIRTQMHPTPRIHPADADLAPPSAEPTLIACSDWRPLGPAYIESGVGSGEHQVKLLCPAGANVQDTFMADGQLHPTKLRLNDWSQIRQE